MAKVPSVYTPEGRFARDERFSRMLTSFINKLIRTKGQQMWIGTVTELLEALNDTLKGHMREEFNNKTIIGMIINRKAVHFWCNKNNLGIHLVGNEKHVYAIYCLFADYAEVRNAYLRYTEEKRSV